MQLFNVRYEPLCVVELQHEYYTRKKFADFSLQPSPATATLMRQYGLLHKQIDNQLYLLVQTEQMRPKRSLDKPLCWSFYVYLKDSYFTNFTNIRLDSFRQRIYHFSNLHANVQGNDAYLTRPIATYDPKTSYHLGDWVQTKDGKYWESIAPDTQGKNPTDNSEYWQACTTNVPCATFLDRISLCGTHELFNQAQAAPAVWGLSANSDTYDQTRNATQLHEQGALCRLSTADKQPDTWAYVDDLAWKQSPFAVIDIHHHPSLPAHNALVDDSGQLRSPRYTIRFASRSTLWRYLLYNKTADALQDKSNQYPFNKISDREFVSRRPIPLSQEPIRSLMLQIPALGAFNLLPNPQVYQIIPEEGKIYSNIHLNL